MIHENVRLGKYRAVGEHRERHAKPGAVLGLETGQGGRRYTVATQLIKSLGVPFMLAVALPA